MQSILNDRNYWSSGNYAENWNSYNTENYGKNQNSADNPGVPEKPDTSGGTDNTEIEKQEKQEEQIKESGQLMLNNSEKAYKIHLLSVIGEIEGHQALGSNTKTTKYEHVLPMLAKLEDDKDVEGMLMIINTVGGDVESGLAIAEMIASLSIPTVSLVLGGSHSIGVPLAVSTDYSFIVPSATMMIHPVRITGMVIGVNQTYRQMEKTQERIIGFVSGHSGISKERMEKLMLDTSQLVKDVGTILDGPETVEEGLIDEVGGIKEAMGKLYEMIDRRRKEAREQEEKGE